MLSTNICRPHEGANQLADNASGGTPTATDAGGCVCLDVYPESVTHDKVHKMRDIYHGGFGEELISHRFGYGWVSSGGIMNNEVVQRLSVTHDSGLPHPGRAAVQDGRIFLFFRLLSDLVLGQYSAEWA